MAAVLAGWLAGLGWARLGWAGWPAGWLLLLLLLSLLLLLLLVILTFDFAASWPRIRAMHKENQQKNNSVDRQLG